MVCPVTGEGNSDDLVKVASARFLPWWVAIVFHLCVCEGDILSLLKHPGPCQTFTHWFFQSLIILARINHYYNGCQMVPFQFYHSFYIYSLASTARKSFPSPHVLIYLYQRGLMDSLPSGGTRCSKLFQTFPGPHSYNQPFILGSLVHFEWIVIAFRNLLGNWHTHTPRAYKYICTHSCIYVDVYLWIYVHFHTSVFIIYHLLSFNVYLSLSLYEFILTSLIPDSF